MKLSKTISGQVIRFLDAPDRNHEHTAVQLARRLEERYGFLQGPNAVRDYDRANGITFLKGIFRTEVIEKLQIFDVGILCEMSAPTEIADAFLDDLTSWANDNFNLGISKLSHPPSGYVSTLEFSSDFRLDTMMKPVSEIGIILSKFLNARGHDLPPYSGWGVRMNLDPGLKNLKPGEFALEHRANKPFAERIYYSTAPLTTKEHLALLEKVEALAN